MAPATERSKRVDRVDRVKGRIAKPEIEKTVLALVLQRQEVDLRTKVFSSLSEKDFQDLRNRLVFRALLSLFNRSPEFDLALARQAYEELCNSQGIVADQAYLAYLHGLSQGDATLIDEYVEILRKARQVWETILWARNLETLAVTKPLEEAYQEILSQVERVPAQLLSQGKPHVPVHDGEALAYFVVDRLEGRANPVRVDLWWPRLAAFFYGGFYPRLLYVVAASSSSGKTTFLVNVLIQAVLQKKKVLFFSAESSAQEIANRIAVAVGDLSLDVLLRKVQPDLDLADRISFALTWMDRNAEYIRVVDETSIHIDMIFAYTRSLAASGWKPDIILVDYLQHLSSPEKNTLAESTKYKMQALKDLAKLFDVPVLVAAQLKRGSGDGRVMSRVFGGGEWDPDVIFGLFLERDDSFGDLSAWGVVQLKEISWNGIQGKGLSIVIDKNRDGPTGVVKGFLLAGKRGKIYDLEAEEKGYGCAQVFGKVPAAQ